MAAENNTLEDKEYGKECPTCGRSDFKSRHGMMLHHASAHGERLGVVTLVCDQCGCEFERKRSMLTDYDNDFCGEECWGKFMENNYAGEDSPAYKGGPVETECANCEVAITKKQHRHERSKRDYCSQECADEHRSEIYVGENHPNYRTIDVECNYCGTTIQRRKSRIERSENFYCSDECFGNWRSENIRGENHPGWKGGPQNLKGFNEPLKAKIRERDGYACRDCGMSNEEHIENHGRKLHVHHVVPRRIFDNAEDAHEESNLISLCYSCHGKWEKMAFLRPQ